jgi:hypothetical protein
VQRDRTGRLVILPTKSASSDRRLVIPRDTVATLKAHRARQDRDRVTAGDAWRDTGLVFANALGGPLEPSTLNRNLHAICDAAGIRRIRFQPLLAVAVAVAVVAIADALDISIAQLAGKISHDLDLAGDWWCAWQTWKNGVARIDTHPLRVDQRGDLLQLDADRAIPSSKAATAGAASYGCGTAKPS